MRIGIDVSQIAFENTGVANYLSSLIEALTEIDKENEYVLFFSSLRKKIQNSKFPGLAPQSGGGKIQNFKSKVKIKKYKFPPVFLDLIWNKLHILPIETFIGDVDIFITSDWTEPPARCKKATIIYDLIVYRHPNETDQKIVSVQKRKLKWVKKESDIIFCISKSTKKDIEEELGIEGSKIKVIYPGL